jgi:hypothetical protein
MTDVDLTDLALGWRAEPSGRSEETTRVSDKPTALVDKSVEDEHGHGDHHRHAH